MGVGKEGGGAKENYKGGGVREQVEWAIEGDEGICKR